MPTFPISTVDGSTWFRVNGALELAWLKRHDFPLVEWPDSPDKFHPHPGQIPAASALAADLQAMRTAKRPTKPTTNNLTGAQK